MDLFSHSWLPLIYQYGFGVLIFGGGLFTIFRAYGGNQFWKEYKIWIQVLVWGFIYIFSIHLFMTLSALNDAPKMYLFILALYLLNVGILVRNIK
jgi:hypothetical protein